MRPWIKLQWPDLPDEAAVALEDCLTEFIKHFEWHYGSQIRRYYQSRAKENMREPTQSDPDDLSF